MNAYIHLTQKNVQINNIPPRLMWNIVDNAWSSSASGYCGEVSVLSAALLYGQYVPMYLTRQLLADYFYTLWGADAKTPSQALQTMWSNYFGVSWTDSGAPGGDYSGTAEKFQAWFKDNGQYYCQLLTQIWDNSKGADNSSFDPTNTVLNNLHLTYEHFCKMDQDTKKNFVPWMKQHVINGHPVIIGVQDFLVGSNDNDFDHIVIVIGWGSNNDLSNTQYYADDEIVFSDHGLVICGQQPHGGSMSFYFRYVMETQSSIATTGGWLPDGGCPDATNPAWDFIIDLGTYRSLNADDVPCSKGEYTCNTYQLAKSPSKNSDGNAGFAITGLSDTLPAGVQVRIDTDCYYEVPCITTKQATTGTPPTTTQLINHSISISGLTAGSDYTVWLFTAKNTAEINQIPTSGFNAYGKKIGAKSFSVSGQTNYSNTFALAADVALFVRCVLVSE